MSIASTIAYSIWDSHWDSVHTFSSGGIFRKINNQHVWQHFTAWYLCPASWLGLSKYWCSVELGFFQGFQPPFCCFVSFFFCLFFSFLFLFSLDSNLSLIICVEMDILPALLLPLQQRPCCFWCSDFMAFGIPDSHGHIGQPWVSTACDFHQLLLEALGQVLGSAARGGDLLQHSSSSDSYLGVCPWAITFKGRFSFYCSYLNQLG